MENERFIKENKRRKKTKSISMKRLKVIFSTRKRLRWASIVLSFLALGSAAAASGTIAWFLLEDDVFQTSVQKKGDLQDLNVIGSSVLKGKATFNDELEVLGDLTLKGTLILEKDVTFGSLGDDNQVGGIDGDEDSTTTINGTLDLKNANVKGLSTLTTTGSATIGDKLEVTGVSNLLEDVTIGDSIDPQKSADLSVTGSTNLGKGLSVTGTTILKGTLVSKMDVTLGSLGNDDQVGGIDENEDSTTTIKGTLNLANTNVQGLSSLTTTGSVIIGDRLEVTSTSSLLGKVTIGVPKDLVTGAAAIPADLLVTGTTTFNGQLYVQKDLFIGTTQQNATLNVYGQTTLNRSVLLRGELIAEKNVIIGVRADTINNVVGAPASLDVTGSTTLDSTLVVKGVSTLLGDVSFGSLSKRTTTTIIGTLDLQSANVEGLENYSFQGELTPKRTTNKDFILPDNFGTNGRVFIEVEVNGVSKTHSILLSDLSTNQTPLEYGYRFSDYPTVTSGNTIVTRGVALWEKIWNVNVTYDKNSKNLSIDLSNTTIVRFKHFSPTGGTTEAQYLALPRVGGVNNNQELTNSASDVGNLATTLVGDNNESYIKSITIIRSKKF